MLPKRAFKITSPNYYSEFLETKIPIYLISAVCKIDIIGNKLNVKIIKNVKILVKFIYDENLILLILILHADFLFILYNILYYYEIFKDNM